MTIEVLDPTYEDQPDDFELSTRLDSLAGSTIGLLSNGKQSTGPFFDAFEAAMRDRYGVDEVVRVTKANYSAPAGDDIMDRARRWHALVAGVGD
ncbi:MAG: hypothetical protein GY708_05170 [Actinomycetia bacterium]|nr:hypothetical protein [Actinomycetes bacterium]MCP4959301.1 hypothetical protein [Actinomycetes bacterium]